ncbi:MAG TPA: transporter associated domain-containing protein [Pseudomonadales bacterium]|jgi:magnesium and cobalt transporter|nr:transporter associated domain-containing protein [Pseudomonadales bacterium]HNI37256.1 transporter associated domain-containing protein [Pseudomonadales bacterium]HNN87493.1 transporter associated domain-containing protein [Pseudomonadales bacterium]
MSDDQHNEPSEKSWLDRFMKAIGMSLRDSNDLLDILDDAHKQKLLDDEMFSIMENALNIRGKTVGDIMVPRRQMVTLKASDSLEAILASIIESEHSRFPVLGDTPDQIVGILLAKKLLPFLLKDKDSFNIQEHLHNANVIPETKRISELLREFRLNRYHMGIVVDEYGNVAGLVTIEDVLEEIVGNIEDETDIEEDERFIRPLSSHDYLVKALTPIEDFNAAFGATLSDAEFDTIGGLVMHTFGHLPRRNEMTTIHQFNFRVLNADKRQIHMLRVTLPTNSNTAAE